MRSTLSGLGDAILLESQHWDETGEASRTSDAHVLDMSEGVDEAERAFRNITGTASSTSTSMEALSLSTEGTSDAFDEVGKSAGEATIAIGQEVVVALTKALLAHEEFKEALSVGAEDLEEYGFNLSEFIEAMVSEEGADAYLRSEERRVGEGSGG